MATKRTTHRSSAGKKLYAVRDKTGSFKDIQTYRRAHGSDVKRKAKAENGPVEAEREACAALVENLKMGTLLLAMGELTTQERRTCKALLGFVAQKIRTRV